MKEILSGIFQPLYPHWLFMDRICFAYIASTGPVVTIKVPTMSKEQTENLGQLAATLRNRKFSNFVKLFKFEGLAQSVKREGAISRIYRIKKMAFESIAIIRSLEDN
jgi:hypothetical protein